MNVISSPYPNNVRPKYSVDGGTYSLLNATLHSGASAFWYILNPTTSTKNVYVKRIVCRSTPTTALVTLTAPRIGVTRLTFTGTTLTPAITSAKMETAEPTPSAVCTTGTTAVGLITATVGATCHSFLISGVMTAVGGGTFSEQQFNALSGEELILVAGEGLMFNQVDASTAADTRAVNIQVVWEENVL
jgi:hypothetical protein